MGSFADGIRKEEDHDSRLRTALRTQLALAVQKEEPSKDEMLLWKNQVMMQYIAAYALPKKYHNFETLDGDTEALASTLAAIVSKLRQRDLEEWALFIATVPEDLESEVYKESPFADMFVFVLNPRCWGNTLFHVNEVAETKGVDLLGKDLFLAIPIPKNTSEYIAFAIQKQ